MKSLLLAAAAVSALALAACSPTETAPVTPPAAEEPVAEPVVEAPVPAPTTIVDIAVANPDLTILVTAIQAAGLAETLSGEGPFTVFAPSNEAGATASVNNLDLSVRVTADGKAMVNQATVTQADIPASNGVVHVIDTVLLPRMEE
jgi:uncharacterized surface protein with fasciclin (FAS1) repeats